MAIKKWQKTLALFVIVGFICLSGTPSKPLSAETEKEKVVATVNGEQITKERLSERARIYRLVMALRSVPVFAEFLMETDEGENSLAKYRKFVLRKLIREKIIDQEADSRGIKVKEDEISRRLDGIIAETKEVDSKKDLMEKLKKDRRTLHDLKEEVSRKLIKEKLRDEVLGKIDIAEGKIKDYYENNRDSFRDKNGEIRPLNQVKDHIREKLRAEKREKLWNEWLKETIKEANIVISMED